LIVLDDARQVVFRKDGLSAPWPASTLVMEGGDPARDVRRAVLKAIASVPGREAQAASAMMNLFREGVDRPIVARALLAISPKDWPKDQAEPALSIVLDEMRKTPVDQRTSAAALDTMQLGDALASLIPVEKVGAVRKELRSLGVPVIRLTTVPDRMLYDKEIIAVQAGKRVEIVFENTDIMPHNLVITKPGSLEDVGLRAESTATEPGAIDRGYVPPSDKILLASRLLQPRDLQRLSFDAPKEPGVYPYVCTYPGHWRRMYGAMYVVEDVDAYAANPAQYVMSAGLEAKDPLLAHARPRTEWKFEDLSSSLAELHHGRSFDSGKQIFQIANCVACHKLNGAGYEIGPDLAKLDAKATAEHILRSLVEPSAEIKDEFATQALELESGQVVTGLVIKETAEELTLVENPLAKSESITIKKSEIAERQKSKTSIMPLGMIDRLSREEVLDLLAYLVARGNEKAEVYKDGHKH
jgi:putative heme-binding domain-containing protein